MGYINTCDRSVFKDWISCGPYNSIITVTTALDPGPFTALLTDKFDHKYRLDVTVGSEGNFEININDLPEGLFNEWGGVIKLEMMKNDCQLIRIPVLKGYGFIKVDSIEIEVKGGTMEKTEIGCGL